MENHDVPRIAKRARHVERRTPKSAEAHKKNLKRLPLGVASNYRAYDPYPIFVAEASAVSFAIWMATNISITTYVWHTHGGTFSSGCDQGGGRASA